MSAPGIDPMGPVRALVLWLVIMLALELTYLLRVWWDRRQAHRAIMGEFDYHLPSSWSSEQVERVREDFLRLERQRARRPNG